MSIVSTLKMKENFVSLKQVDDEKIKAAEEELGLKFNEDYKKCIKEFGIFSFDGHEFTGISPSNRLDIVAVTKEYRDLIKDVKDDLYVIEKLGIDNIVIWQNTEGKIYQSNTSGTFEKIADSFEDYINE